jgi:hypothetical protein
MNSPKNNIDTRDTDKSQRDSARQGVFGIVLCGRKKFRKRLLSDIC